MKAALAGRQDPRLVIVGRTSAIGITGVDDTIARLKAYEAAGVDMLFMAGLKNRARSSTPFSAAIKLPLFLGGVPEDLMDLDYLSARNVRVCLQGHHRSGPACRASTTRLRRCARREALRAEERRLGRPAEEAAAPGRLRPDDQGFSRLSASVPAEVMSHLRSPLVVHVMGVAFLH